jgi:ketosteroid isomerase-like protein
MSNSPTAEGKQAIAELHQRELGQGPVKISLAGQETEISGDWAYERGTAAITVTPKGAKGPVELPSRYLVILRRQADGSWRVHRDLDNNSSPPPGAPEAGKK